MKLRNIGSSAAVALLIGGLFSFGSGSASASTYDWTLTGAIDGSGTITTDDVSVKNGNSFGTDIVSITGTFNGAQITGLNGLGDNILYPSNFGSDGFGNLKGALDALGIGLTTGAVTANIFFAGTADYTVESGGSIFTNESFTEVAATPLPPTWVLMLGGLGTIGFLALRRAKTQSTGFAVG